MLQKIHIQNIALIDELEIEFDSNFIVISGETGAGKSIIVDSLFLLLGGKYDKSLLKHDKTTGFVEGVFDTNTICSKVLIELGFEDSEQIIVKRKFNNSGKNEIKINGQNATPSMLKSITSTLVDIYGQNQYLSFNKKSEQLDILDSFLDENSQQLKLRISNEYKEYKQILKQIQDLGDASKRLRELEMLKFQIDEIQNADIKQEEEQQLIDKRKIILSSQKIKNNLSSILETLDKNDDSILSKLSSIKPNINYLNTILDNQSILDRLDSVRLEIIDITETLGDSFKELDFNPKEIDDIEKRLEIIRNIKRKYGDYKQCKFFLNECIERYKLLENADSINEKLQKQCNYLSENLYNLSINLSQIRREIAVQISQKIIHELAELGMKDSMFEIKFDEILSKYNVNFSQLGLDTIEFYLSTNKGHPLKPLSKIASGGEMSRFMLCLKTITSSKYNINTLIFDEIDAGISGVIGQEVAKKLAKISKHTQVICISHLPQIVSFADYNLLITKSSNQDTTTTKVNYIKGEQLIQEIARLTGGINISKQALETAKEMKEWCDNYKQSL
ncbi:MAG: DNA repair protein RecN [Firmicutes bacterium]|nr:DNA repair protein RecN [Bacillota bacterium]MCL1953138.1 DNA repair protein RecN [Bacillota bacterium]